MPATATPSALAVSGVPLTVPEPGSDVAPDAEVSASPAPGPEDSDQAVKPRFPSTEETLLEDTVPEASVPEIGVPDAADTDAVVPDAADPDAAVPYDSVHDAAEAIPPERDARAEGAPKITFDESGPHQPPPISTAAEARARIRARQRADQSRFELALGQKIMLVVGIIVMIFGIGFFLKYTFDQGWIGPPVRVAMTYLWGLVMLGTGEYARRKGYNTFGLYLFGGAVVVLYFGAYAGYDIYNLVGTTWSFVIMILVTCLAIGLSVLYGSLALAILALFGGFLTPVLLSTGEDQQVALMTYMTFLNGGILTLAFFKRWTILAYLGLGATQILYATWFFTHNQPVLQEKFWPAIIFLNIFFLIYAIIPFFYDLTAKKRDSSHAGYMLIPNVIYSFSMSLALIMPLFEKDWGALVCLGYAAVLAVLGGYLLVKGKGHLPTFLIMGLFLGLLLLPALFFITSDQRVTQYWIILAVAFFLVGIRFAKTLPMVWSHIFSGLALWKFFLYDYLSVFELTGKDSTPYYELLNNTWFALYFTPGYTYFLAERMLTSGLLLGSLLLASLVGRQRNMNGAPITSGTYSFTAGLYGFLFIGALFLILTIECSAMVHDYAPPLYAPAATMSSLSVLWTVFSVLLIIVGFRLKVLALRIVALALFTVTLFKVFLMDLSQVSAPYRILSFLVLGTLLMGTSFLYYKYKDRIVEEDEHDTPGTGKG
ncbi:MAG: DUF2339 domain-containing protein [Desulfovibrio sp.]|nr:MAG: DUF2339 domain-containing protein [Desulfovibrio sp.]